MMRLPRVESRKAEVGAWANPTTTEFRSEKPFGWNWVSHFSKDLNSPLPCIG